MIRRARFDIIWRLSSMQKSTIVVIAPQSSCHELWKPKIVYQFSSFSSPTENSNFFCVVLDWIDSVEQWLLSNYNLIVSAFRDFENYYCLTCNSSTLIVVSFAKLLTSNLPFIFFEEKFVWDFKNCTDWCHRTYRSISLFVLLSIIYLIRGEIIFTYTYSNALRSLIG